MASVAATSTKMFMYDLVVIGGGSGGVRCARISAGHGAKVALVETSLKHGPPSYTAIGGTCVNVGCVPKKLLVYASQYRHEFESATNGYGWRLGESSSATTMMTNDWAALVAQKNKEITRLNGAYGKILANAGRDGVTVIEGHGALVDANTVQVTKPGTQEPTLITAKNIVLSMGGWPYIPSEVQGAREYAITSNEAFYLPDRPQRILVVGGGYIAVEFASIFKGLGSTVTQMYRGSMILRGFDDDVRKFLYDEMRKKDIDVQLNTNPAKIEKLASGALRVTTEAGGSLEVDAVMYATGRRPKLDGVGIDKVGIKVGDKHQVVVDEWSRTNVPNIYAVGDCTERMDLTPVALREGHLLADALFGTRKRTVDYDLVPSAVFSQPEIGTVGLTEEAAVKKHRNVTVYTTSFKAMKHTMTTSTERSYMKMLVDDESHKVIGLHMVGEHAGEIVQGFAVAMKAGATKEDFDDTIGIHPTSAEEFVTMRTPSYRYQNGTKL